MKRKTRTDTPTQLTAEEHNAFLRIHHATAGEDRWKCGLEYICNRLDDARGYAEAAAERILPDVADVKLNPAPTLESLCATPPEWGTAVKLPELCERIFDQLKKEIAIKPDFELLRRKGRRGETRLERFVSEGWFVFLFGWNGNGGLGAFMRKKIALARALGKHEAADKFDEAFRQLMPAFLLTDWEQDTKRFAAEIAPDDFHVAFRNAMKLDEEATAEINGERKSTSLVDSLKEIRQEQIALSEGQSAQNDFLIGIGKTVNEIDRNTRPDKSRPDDKEVAQPDAARILTDAGYRVSARQIQNWDRYIKTNGVKGTQPPEGYRIELRTSFLTFNAWAQKTASHKRMNKALQQRRQRAHKTNV